MQDLNDKINGGTLSATEWNQVPSELQNVIAAFGAALSAGDLDQLGKAVAGYAGAAQYYSCSGSANAYTATRIGSVQAPTSYADGMMIRFRPSANNTGASTINVNALGVKTIVREDGTDLLAGQLSTTKDAWARYSSSLGKFYLSNWSATDSPATPVTPKGHIWGLTLSNAADTDHDITIDAGIARSADDAQTITVPTAITKQIDTAGGWVVGNNQAGRPTGVSLSNATWYHVFVIRKNDGTVDAGFDTSLTAANLITTSGYNQYRRIGSVLTDGSANIINFIQAGDEFQYKVAQKDYDADNPGTGSVQVTVCAPLGIRTMAHLVFGISDTSGTNRAMNVSPGDGGTNTPVLADPHDLSVKSGSAYDHSQIDLITDTSSRIRFELDGSGAALNVTIFNHGYQDHRGREA